MLNLTAVQMQSPARVWPVLSPDILRHHFGCHPQTLFLAPAGPKGAPWASAPPAIYHLGMRYLLLLCSIVLLFGGTETKPKVEDYEVHARTKNIAIGAEYTVHSFSRGEQMFIANDYLVVEVALFPPKETAFEVLRGDFSLRINKREPLDAAEPKLVVAQMEHPEWQPERPGLHAEGAAGLGVRPT
jgi:hypothetical protein